MTPSGVEPGRAARAAAPRERFRVLVDDRAAHREGLRHAS
jgi:hypothetical protein